MNEVHKIAKNALENYVQPKVIDQLTLQSSIILSCLCSHMIKHKYHAPATMHSSCATLEYIFPLLLFILSAGANCQPELSQALCGYHAIRKQQITYKDIHFAISFYLHSCENLGVHGYTWNDIVYFRMAQLPFLTSSESNPDTTVMKGLNKINQKQGYMESYSYTQRLKF